MRDVVAAIAAIKTSCGTDDAVAVVMLRHPVAMVSQRFAVPGEIQRFPNRDVLTTALSGGRPIEYR